MVEKQLFQIIRYFIKGDPVTIELDWANVWSLAKKHSLTQFVALYMYKLPEEQRPKEKLQSVISSHYASLLTQHVNQKKAINDIHSTLEKMECYHLFMKGSVTKQRYANPFYRSMGDIDFVYKDSQHEKVKLALLKNGFTDYKEGRKNDFYYRKPYVCVEAHRQLVPSDSSYYTYCSSFWQRAHITRGCKYCYEMNLEDELIFNIIHLAIHFLEGGAGIRFILDVYVYNEHNMDTKYIERELTNLNLLEFYHNISDLAENWFGEGEETEISKKIAEFVLNNGTFGKLEYSSALAVRNGRLKYFSKMCFPSFNEMASLYPWLKKRKFLLPVAWIIRGLKVQKYKKGTIRNQLIKASQGDIKLGRELYAFYNECGLRGTL